LTRIDSFIVDAESNARSYCGAQRPQ